VKVIRKWTRRHLCECASRNEFGSARRGQWHLINIVCFTEPNIDGNYLNEKEYSIREARSELKRSSKAQKPVVKSGKWYPNVEG
jgi:hypothetical protein